MAVSCDLASKHLGFIKGGIGLLDQLSVYWPSQEDAAACGWLSSWSDTLVQNEGMGFRWHGTWHNNNNNNNSVILVQVLADSADTDH